MMEKTILPGVGVLVLKENKILLGKRIGKHGYGTWGPPGGKIEYFESFQDCALRETREETGLIVRLMDEYPIPTNNLFRSEGLHTISLLFRAEYLGGEPKIMEPERCQKWGWFSWNNLPSPLFIPIEELIKQDYNPFY